MMVMFLLVRRRTGVMSGEKEVVVLFLGELRRALRVERFHFLEMIRSELTELSDEMDELPRLHVVVASVAPRRHPRQSDAVLDDPVDLAVGEALRIGQPHVGSARVEVAPDFSLSAAVVGVAARAMVGKMRARLVPDFLGKVDGVARLACARRHGPSTRETTE